MARRSGKRERTRGSLRIRQHPTNEGLLGTSAGLPTRARANAAPTARAELLRAETLRNDYARAIARAQ
eukprot:9720012-Lingulodinium_polyedra.AAC.1